MSQKPLAAPCDVRIGPVEVAAVPGVGDVTGGVGEVQQQFQLALRVGLQNAHGVGQIVRLHGQQIVVPVIVFPPPLPSGLPSGGAAVPLSPEHPSGEAAITNRINYAELPETGGRGTGIFYVLGAFLTMAGTALLLLQKRCSFCRMTRRRQETESKYDYHK